MFRKTAAHNYTVWHEGECAESSVGCGVAARHRSVPGRGTKPAKGVVLGWATAESPTAGCVAGREWMARVLSRSSQASRWLRWIGARGNDEPVTDDPAA
jgi:hypothetical protein